MVRDIQADDVASICEIYNHYVANSIATFEEESVRVADMRRRVSQITEGYPWIVFEESDEVLGYAYASRWKERSAYRYSVETTVYLGHKVLGRGIGTALYRELLARLSSAGCRTAIAGISLPNEASVRLHEKVGFEQVAHFKKVGWKQGKWIDVGYWQIEISSPAPDEHDRA